MSGRKLLMMDAFALVAYIVASNPVLTGADAHEWVGLGVTLVFLLHVAQHISWARSTLGGWRCATRSARGNLVVDALAFVALAICAISGALVSGAVLPAFGLYSEGYFFWNPLHALFAKVLLALLVVHFVIHIGWVFGQVSPRGGLGKERRLSDDGE